jgi:hypothetical protein
MRIRPTVKDYELKEPKWWLNHHKESLSYVCQRIKKLVDNPDDEEYRKFFYSHFSATIDQFLEGAGHE